MTCVPRLILAVLLCAPASAQLARLAPIESRGALSAPAALSVPAAMSAASPLLTPSLTVLPAALAPVPALPAVAAAPAAAPAAVPTPASRAAVAAPRAAPRIAVIGGGLAGLSAVHELARLGYDATLYEADARLGGRAKTSRDAASGLMVDEGAEFVSSTHGALLDLMGELGVRVLPRRAAGLRRTFFYEGKPVDEAAFQRRLFREAGPQLRALARDEKEIRRAVAAGRADVLRRYDEATIGSYLDGIKAPPILRTFVESVVDSESGRDYRTLSAVVLFECLSADPKRRRVAILPDEDEVYRIDGGAGAIVDGLARRHAGSVALGRRLTALDSDDGKTFRLAFQTPEGPRAAEADYVVMALPQPALKDVALRTPGWTEASRRAVESVEFGAHLKLTLFFARRVWAALKHSGGGFNDSGFVFWDSSEGQKGPAGSITFLGRASSLPERPGELAWRFLDQLGRAFPGLLTAFRGFKVSVWPNSYPFADVPGHPYGFTLTYLNRRVPAKLDAAPLGNLHWAGDFFSANSPAYMNGAVESGQAAARAIARSILGR